MVIKNISKEVIGIAALVLVIFFFKETEIRIYKIFHQFNNLSENTNYKDFFINITEVGDSLWFFLISLTGIIFFYFLKKISNDQITVGREFLNFFLFFFTALVITGTITQLIKHLLGRPRPNYSMESGFFEFDFFNISSQFHSFPSGHASTIFLVAFILSLTTPNIRYIYFFFLLA